MMACKLAMDAAVSCDAALPGVLPPGTWQTIITDILSIFGGCMAPATPAEAQADVTAAWQPNGYYDPGTLRIAARHAMRAANQAGTRLARNEAFTAAPIILDHIRTADTADMDEAYKACMVP
jgi:hypothetical protein